MAETRGYMRAFVESGSEPGHLLRRLHRALAADLNGAQYITLCYVLDRRGDVRLVLHSTGSPVGLLDGPRRSGSAAIPLEAGDLVLFLTDGITEAENSDAVEFGAARALAHVRCRAAAPARELVDGLCAEVRAFCGGEPPHDDITALACRFRG
jgi:sigma-B regulation protein RsbU (phosphoserine phosphatase)